MSKIATAVELMKEHHYEEAANLFNEHIEENPNDPLGYINFGNLLLHLGDLDHAKNFFEKALSLDAESATASYGLGNLYYEQENFQEARKHFLAALQSGLGDADVYFMLGMCHQNRQEFKLALPYLLRAKELLTQDEEVLFQYGLALAQLEMLAEAKVALEEVLAVNHQHSDALYNLGVIALYHEDVKGALEYFDQALKSDPNHVLAANGKNVAEQALNS